MSERSFDPDASRNASYLEQIEQLENAFAQQNEQFQQQSLQLQSAIEALGLAASAPRHQTLSPESSSTVQEAANSIKLKLEKPEDFHGERSKLRPFLANLRLKFFAEPHLFRNEQSKIAYAGSLLRSTAFAWFEPKLANIDAYMSEVGTFNAFAESLKVAFGDPDEAATAERELRKLFQGNRPITAYTADFLRISSQLDWDDAALKAAYRFGLSERVKDELARIDEPLTRNHLVEVATRIDARLHARDLERKDLARSPEVHGIRPNPKGFQPTVARVTHETTRQIKSEYPARTGNRGPAKGPLDATEKQRRFDNNLCLYCASPAHRRAECPLVPKVAAATQMAEDTAEN